ncbi:hypothetical protein ACTWPT_19605 [Nonomuraea sp. 3N208]|uniref:hypothetical protein n=1 Tax=Nonomuraea sp. 3N208 TaxID=3457421 RepID=UPI003FCE40CB
MIHSQPPGADFIAYRLAYKGRHATRYTLPASWRPVVRHLDKIMGAGLRPLTGRARRNYVRSFAVSCTAAPRRSPP